MSSSQCSTTASVPEGAMATTSTVRAPSCTSYTEYLQETTSYRWVISNFSTFLQNYSGKVKLTSPTFQISLPRSIHYNSSTSWYLSLTETEDTPDGTISIFLCQQGRGGYNQPQPKFWILDCKFSVLNHYTSKVLYSASVPRKEYTANQEIDDFGVVDFIQIDKFLYDDTLTIQVDAKLYFFAQPTTKSIAPNAFNSNINKVESLLTGMKHLLEDQIFTDVTIVCGDKEFKAHKAILASQSPVFRKMLEVDMKEKRSNLIEISDCHPEVIAEMLTWFYTGNTPNMNMLARDLLFISNKYELSGLFEASQDKLKSWIDVTTAVDMLVFADVHCATSLKTACLSFIRNNSREVYKTVQWRNFKENFDHHSLFIEMVEQR